MKRVLLLAFVLVLSCSTYGQTTEFLERVISYRDGRSNFFIPINVKSESFSGKVVVESYVLADYLKETRGFDAKTYRSFMLSLLKERQALEMKNVVIDHKRCFLSGKNVKEGSFRIVETSQAFEAVFVQGCDQVIRYYFSPSLPQLSENRKSSCKDIVKQNGADLFIRPRYDFDEQNNVIVRLFEIDIPVYRDDISGSLEIAYSILM